MLARPENGKTTFCLNAGRKWVEGIPPIGFAYFGTEEGAESQQLRFAAMLSGNPPAEVVAGEYHKIGGEDAKREVGEAVKALHVGRYRDLVFFAEETRPTLRDVSRAAHDAVRLGLPILVLDHFHRMAVPESHDQVATLTETVRRVKQLAVDTGLVILMAAQAKRVEGLARFMPPNPESGKGTGGLEEEADVMLGLFGRWGGGVRRITPTCRCRAATSRRSSAGRSNRPTCLFLTPWGSRCSSIDGTATSAGRSPGCIASAACWPATADGWAHEARQGAPPRRRPDERAGGRVPADLSSREATRLRGTDLPAGR